ncbi:hypothetical protein [Streptomyces sp. NPDC047315]|uniref:hypothetical protein n=1 Tax=Streptomyces sp. NPDC047315 TaxID=3155142 RepID=UPI0033F1DD9E
MAGLAVFGLLAAGCSAGGTGLQDEGSAYPDSAKGGTTPSPAGSGSSAAPNGRAPDPVKLLLEDPKVHKRIKADLKPCTKENRSYPVDSALGNLTGASSPDVVVNVMTCGDAVNVGTYVFRPTATGYENVFASEEPAVVSSIDRGDLVVTKQVYEEGAPVAAQPTAEEVTTFHWSGSRFNQLHWVRNQYPGGGDGDGGEYVFPAEPPAEVGPSTESQKEPVPVPSGLLRRGVTVPLPSAPPSEN